jgi:phosphoribosylformylglycinamidine (FGAM) synthase PurS component
MEKTVQMAVGLKMPDNTAVTALFTLKDMGLTKLYQLCHATYYKFTIEGDLKDFKEKICKVDILVNSNKHACQFIDLGKKPHESQREILVKNLNQDNRSLLSTLQHRLGFKGIKSVEKGILWGLKFKANEKESQEMAEKAAKELLASEHYQEYKIL